MLARCVALLQEAKDALILAHTCRCKKKDGLDDSSITEKYGTALGQVETGEDGWSHLISSLLT